MYEAVILFVSLASFDESFFEYGTAYGDVYAIGVAIGVEIGVAVVLVLVLLMHFLQMKSSLSSISSTFLDQLRNRSYLSRKRCDLNVAKGQTYLFFSNRNLCVSVNGKAQHLCHLR
jgi:hypothetical protein